MTATIVPSTDYGHCPFCGGRDFRTEEWNYRTCQTCRVTMLVVVKA